jgi:hypothetical protein
MSQTNSSVKAVAGNNMSMLITERASKREIIINSGSNIAIKKLKRSDDQCEEGDVVFGKDTSAEDMEVIVHNLMLFNEESTICDTDYWGFIVPFTSDMDRLTTRYVESCTSSCSALASGTVQVEGVAMGLFDSGHSNCGVLSIRLSKAFFEIISEFISGESLLPEKLREDFKTSLSFFEFVCKETILIDKSEQPNMWNNVLTMEYVLRSTACFIEYRNLERTRLIKYHPEQIVHHLSIDNKFDELRIETYLAALASVWETVDIYTQIIKARGSISHLRMYLWHKFRDVIEPLESL